MLTAVGKGNLEKLVVRMGVFSISRRTSTTKMADQRERKKEGREGREKEMCYGDYRSD